MRLARNGAGLTVSVGDGVHLPIPVRSELPEGREVVAAFDTDARKVGKDLCEAIFAMPNCTAVFHGEVPHTGVTVRMGRFLDGRFMRILAAPAKTGGRFGVKVRGELVSEEIEVNPVGVFPSDATSQHLAIELSGGLQAGDGYC